MHDIHRNHTLVNLLTGTALQPLSTELLIFQAIAQGCLSGFLAVFVKSGEAKTTMKLLNGKEVSGVHIRIQRAE